MLVRDLGGVLGRLSFAAGPLERIRPFLSCLYSWVSVVPASSFLTPPPAVLLCLRWIARKLDHGARLADCRLPKHDAGELFRTDAKAEGDNVVIGGWECRDGTLPGQARWFSVRLCPANSPWLHCWGEPFRVIAALVMLATLYAVLAFLPEGAAYDGGAVLSGSATTDTLGNSYVVAKLMTTSFPLNVVLMELTEQLDLRGSWLQVRWAARHHNVEADALTNEEFGDFDPDRRLHLAPEDMPWILLHEMMEAGGGTVEELRVDKAKKKAERAELKAGRKRRRAGEPLRELHTWRLGVQQFLKGDGPFGRGLSHRLVRAAMLQGSSTSRSSTTTGALRRLPWRPSARCADYGILVLYCLECRLYGAIGVVAARCSPLGRRYRCQRVWRVAALVVNPSKPTP